MPRPRMMVLAVVLVSALTAASGAVAQETGHWQLTTSLGAGAVAPDQSLADYRWDTSPASLMAVQAVATRGRWAGGVRLSRWSVIQGTGLSSAEDIADPTVRLTQYEVVGQFRVARAAGFQLWGTALGGLVDLRYSPESVTIPGPGPDGDITVEFAPLTEPVVGLGLEIRRPFGDSWVTSLTAEGSRFSLETNHRRGDEIVTERTAFTNWGLKLQVGWVFDLG